MSDCRQDEQCPVIQANQEGHCDVVKLERAAKVNVADDNCRAALILESHNGHSDVVKLMPEREASANPVSEDGGAAFIQTSQEDNIDI